MHINNLPPELLLHIFSMCCIGQTQISSGRGVPEGCQRRLKRSVLRSSAVCNSWRNLILQDERMWILVLGLTLRFGVENDEIFEAGLNESCDAIAQFPACNVALTIHSPPSVIGLQLELENFFIGRLLEGCADRLLEAYLVLNKSVYLQASLQAMLRQPLPVLEYLWVHSSNVQPFQITDPIFEGCSQLLVSPARQPRLTSLSLADPPLLASNIRPSQHLRQLYLGFGKSYPSVEYQNMLLILQACNGLKHLTLRILSSFTFGGVSGYRHEDLCLLQLKHLEIMSYGHYLRCILLKLKAPNLSFLHLATAATHMPSCAVLPCSLSFPNLRSLHVQNLDGELALLLSGGNWSSVVSLRCDQTIEVTEWERISWPPPPFFPELQNVKICSINHASTHWILSQSLIRYRNQGVPIQVIVDLGGSFETGNAMCRTIMSPPSLEYLKKLSLESISCDLKLLRDLYERASALEYLKIPVVNVLEARDLGGLSDPLWGLHIPPLVDVASGNVVSLPNLKVLVLHDRGRMPVSGYRSKLLGELLSNALKDWVENRATAQVPLHHLLVGAKIHRVILSRIKSAVTGSVLDEAEFRNPDIFVNEDPFQPMLPPGSI